MVARFENYRRPRGDSHFLSPKRKRPRQVEPAAPEHKQQTPEPDAPPDIEPLPRTEPLVAVEPSEAAAKAPPTTLKKNKGGRPRKKSKRGKTTYKGGRPKINAPKLFKPQRSKRLHLKARKEAKKEARKVARKAAREAG